MTSPAVFSAMDAQPRVQAFFSRALAEGRLSHAYLFVGAPGSGQAEAARALAQALVCPRGGCGACDDCRRVAHGTHPDVRWVEPASASRDYLVDQVRELIEEASLAPVRAERKVFVIDRADRLRANAANALLKTIEEPPEGVVFILMAPSANTVLATIASRCQAVPFRTYLADEAADSLAAEQGTTCEEARLALSVAGRPDLARTYLGPAGGRRREARRQMTDALANLGALDDWEVLKAAKAVADAAAGRELPYQEESQAVKAQLDALKAAKRLTARRAKELAGALDDALAGKSVDPDDAQPLRDALAAAEAAGSLGPEAADGMTEAVNSAAQRGTEDEYLSAKARNEREKQAEREVSAQERSSIMETVSAAESLLRDVLVRAQGVPQPPVNYDLVRAVDKLAAQATPERVLEALAACGRARSDMERNVTPRLALEAMLLDIKEALWRA